MDTQALKQDLYREDSYDREQDDYLVRGTAKNGLLRCVAVRTVRVCDTARKYHDLSPIATVALGRLMTGALLLGIDQKNTSDQLSLVVRGNGPIGGMTAIAEPKGKVRGLVGNPHTEAVYLREGKYNVGAVVGQGQLTVVRNTGLKEPYVGSTNLVSGEIAEDLTAYCFYSEQVPTILALGVKVESSGVVAAGGLLIQVMPGATDELLDWLEKRAAGFPDITDFVSDGFNPHQLIDLFLGDPELEYGSSYPVSYQCDCSKERMEKALLTLGDTELQELAQDEQGITLECHFCPQKYHFNQEEIKQLLARGK